MYFAMSDLLGSNSQLLLRPLFYNLRPTSGGSAWTLRFVTHSLAWNDSTSTHKTWCIYRGKQKT